MSELAPSLRLSQDLKTDVTLVARVEESPGGDQEVVGTSKKTVDCAFPPILHFPSRLNHDVLF